MVFIKNKWKKKCSPKTQIPVDNKIGGGKSSTGKMLLLTYITYKEEGLLY